MMNGWLGRIRPPKLRARFFIHILVFVLMPVTVLFALAIRVFTTVVDRTVHAQIGASLERMEQDVDTLLRDLVDTSNAILTENTVLEALEAPWSSFEKDRALSPTLDTIISMVFDGASYTLLDRDGGIYTSWSRNLNDYAYVPDLPLVVAARSTPRSTVWTDFEPALPIEDRSTGKRQVSLARSVYEPFDSRAYLGVLILSVDEAAFRQIFRRHGATAYQEAVALLGADGRVRTAYNPRGFPDTVLEAARAGHTVRVDGQSYIGSTRTLRPSAGPAATPWVIASLSSVASIRSAVARVTRGLSIGFVVLLLAVAAIAGVVSTRLVRPVVRLSRIMKVWSLDSEDGFAPTNRADEVGELERSFAGMRANIRELFDRARREHEAREQYRYQALRSQLNPHFLFNSLNMIRWLALIQKSQPIVSSIDALSGLLSYSMGKEGDWVTLGEELDAITRYLVIHNFRFGASFDLVVDAEEGLRSAIVLRFILQPLVENSVLHGYGEAEGGAIRVLARRGDGRLELVVEDDGGGMAEEIAVSVFHKPATAGRPSGKATALGLFNVNEMIKISCGEAYGLSIVPRQRGCAVRCAIPLRLLSEASP